MHVPILEYILLSKEDRQKHLNLDEECICIGGMSGEYRGLLAHYLKTTIPTKCKVYLCHACHNALCSNPRHLYWGTPAENVSDMIDSGNWKSIADRTRDKYGEDAKFIFKRLASTGGTASKIKRKSRISSERMEEILRVLESETHDRGSINRIAKKLNVSHTQVRRYIKKYGSLAQ